MKTVRNSIFLCFFLLVCLGTANAQWVKTSAPLTNVFGIATDGIRIFAASNNEGVFVSTDDGTTWQKRKLDPDSVTDSLIAKEMRGMEIFGDTLYVFGPWISKMHVADTMFSSYQSLNLGPYTATTIFVSGEVLVVGGGTHEGMFRSTDYGITWTGSTYPSTFVHVNVLSAFGSTLLAGTYDTLYRSTDFGANWIPVYSLPPLGANLSCFHNHSSGLYAGGRNSTSPLLLRSTDDGVSWISVPPVGILPTTINSIASHELNLFCVVIGRGVYTSTNVGANWTISNTGLTSPNQSNKIIVKGTNVFLSTYLTSSIGSGVWERPVSQLTDIESILVGDVPSSFSLDQNFPNPFNPATTFRFSVPSEEYVTLKVYDSFGQEVTTLISEELNAGQYEKQWDASGASVNNPYASGVYYYRLQAGNFIQTKKMLLLR